MRILSIVRTVELSTALILGMSLLALSAVAGNKSENGYEEKTMNIASTQKQNVQTLPAGFMHLSDIDSSIEQEIRYYSSNNLMGRPLNGYNAPNCILTREAALALSQVQQELKPLGLGLKVFDGYRPQKAVDDIISWSQDTANQKMKAEYYPHINKADFVKLSYVMEKSGHTRGSTVDLTLIQLDTKKELDMGTTYDFMDERSHPLNSDIPEEAYKNRMLLRNIMEKNGFAPLETEWWHFTLKNEPFPDQYFDFPVT